jgi:hypothetical protein
MVRFLESGGPTAGVDASWALGLCLAWRCTEPRSVWTRMVDSVYIHALFYILCVEYYSIPSCYTEQNSVLFSIHVSVLFSIFVVLGVVLSDTEHCSVVLSIFSTQFWLVV